jgi:hypothetical protein
MLSGHLSLSGIIEQTFSSRTVGVTTLDYDTLSWIMIIYDLASAKAFTGEESC